MQRIRTILVPITGGTSDRSILDAAAVVARTLEAHVTVIHARPNAGDLVPFMTDGLGPGVVDQVVNAAVRDSDARLARAREAFETWRGTSGLPVADKPGGVAGASVAFREVPGREDDAIARHGRFADMIVIGQPGKTGSAVAISDIEAALLDAGRAVLLVPQGAELRFEGAPILVAWNGSSEGSRAITWAMPFLARASRVVVLSVSEEGPKADPAPLIEYLGWHGVSVPETLATGPGTSTGHQLLEQAARIGAGMVVMGAYTRSRIRQLVFGGVTSHVLANAKLPVLMKH
jgi:nucleotide-binding universal stress UspA family protein